MSDLAPEHSAYTVHKASCYTCNFLQLHQLCQSSKNVALYVLKLFLMNSSFTALAAFIQRNSKKMVKQSQVKCCRDNTIKVWTWGLKLLLDLRVDEREREGEKNLEIGKKWSKFICLEPSKDRQREC